MIRHFFLDKTNIENYKIVILGDQHVGKTSILSKYKYETVEEGYAVIYLY